MLGSAFGHMHYPILARRAQSAPCFIIPLAMALGCVGSLSAADSAPWNVVFNGEARWTAPVDCDDDNSGRHTIATNEQMGELRAFYRPYEGLRVGLGVGAERGDYDDDDGDRLRVRALWVRLPAAVMFSPHWGLTSLTSYGGAAADGADVLHDRRWAVQAGPLWVRDDKLLIGLLVNCTTRVGQRPGVFPFPTVEWQITPDWHLTIVDEMDSISRLTWRAAQDYALGLRVDVRLREYSLADDHESVMTDDQLALGLEGTWLPCGDDKLRLTAFAGAEVLRNLTYIENGTTVDTQRAGAAFTGGLQARADF